MTSEQLRSFWDKARAELADVPLDAQIQPWARQPDVLAQVYDVTLTSLGGVKLRAVYAVPSCEETYPRPALITFPGYGGDTIPLLGPALMEGCAVMTLYPRGQGPSREFWQVPNGYTKLTLGLDSPENHYYRAAYMDCLRGLDFLTSRSEVDSSRLGVCGTSQGGGLALAAAALDHRVKACATHVPFLCAYRIAVETATTGPYLELTAHFAKHPDQRAQALTTLEWFDPLSLATWIEAPTLISIGDLDTCCPGPTIEAMYSRLCCKRALIHYPDLVHAWRYDFRQQTSNWMNLYL